MVLKSRLKGAFSWVAHKTAGRLKQLVEGVEAEGWRFVALMRLVPLVPFNLLNYALGLTRIRLTHYTLAGFREVLVLRDGMEQWQREATATEPILADR